uniref:Uncharacterized protein n=1 Tax=Lepeophtheirus salmonis TaxID=72036 RepID=A0A0K2U4G8_LEPSM
MAALNSNYSLHLVVVSLAGVEDELLGQVVTLLHNGGLQGVHVWVKCLVSLPLQSSRQGKVKWVQIRKKMMATCPWVKNQPCCRRTIGRCV